MQSVFRFVYHMKGETDKRPPNPSWFMQLCMQTLIKGVIHVYR